MPGPVTAPPRPAPRAPSVGELLRMMGWRVLIMVLFTIPAIAALREPSPGWRICLIVLAAMIASTPLVVRTLERRRRHASEISVEATHAARRAQTSLEIRRVVEARVGELDALRARHRTAVPAAWRKLVERYAVSVVLPEMSHPVALADRQSWLHETITAIDALLAARAAPAPVRDAATLVDHCVAILTAAGWESWVTPGDVVTARRSGARVIFFCIDANAKIDKALIDRCRARCHAAGVRCSAIVATQRYPAEAVVYARTVRTGLIRLTHVEEMLRWAAKGVASAGALQITPRHRQHLLSQPQ